MKFIIFLFAFFIFPHLLFNQSLENGQLIKIKDQDQIFVVIGNAKFPVNSRKILRQFGGRSEVSEISSLEFKKLADIPTDTILVREDLSNKTYLIFNNLKYLVPEKTLELFFGEAYVNILPKNSLSHISNGKVIYDMGLFSPQAFDSIKTFLAHRLKSNLKINSLKLNTSKYNEHQYKELSRMVDIQINKFPNYIPSSLPSSGIPYPPFGIKNVYSNPDSSKQTSVMDSGQKWEENLKLRGFADLHCHQFANLAFSGKLLIGDAYGSNQIALPECSLSPLASEALRIATYSAALPACILGCVPLTIFFPPAYLACVVVCDISVGEFIRQNIAAKALEYPHGAEGFGDFIGNAMKISYISRGGKWSGYENIFGHNGSGFPNFSGWPSWDNLTHQAVFHDALFRAFQGGLRLMVMMTVENECLCNKATYLNAGIPKYKCNEMESVYRQINAAKAFEKYIMQAEGGWYRIAYSSEEAEKIIKEGKLAVILGVEISDILDCNKNCDYQKIQSQLNLLFENGIRVILPVHKSDNSFGGTSYNGDWPVLQKEGEGHPLGEPCYRINTVVSDKYYTKGVNKVGLTDFGRFFIEAMIIKGIIIDVDHMSEATRIDVFRIAKDAGYSGIISSHSGFNEINRFEQNHEGQLNPLDLTEIYQLGGMVAPILNQAINKREIISFPGGGINHDCGWSSESWAQAYLYARYNFGNGVKGIAIGTDFNGNIPPIGPRFGFAACPGTGTSNKPMLSYPFVSIFDSKPFDKSKIGNRIYDMNYDGVAHYGMLPDLIADLQALGIKRYDLEPFLNSAKEFVVMWDKAIQNKLTKRYKIFGFIIVKELNNDKVWLLENGTKCHIPDEVALNEYGGWEKVRIIPDGALNNVPISDCLLSVAADVKRISIEKLKVKFTISNGHGIPIDATVMLNGNFIGNSSQPFSFQIGCSKNISKEPTVYVNGKGVVTITGSRNVEITTCGPLVFNFTIDHLGYKSRKYSIEANKIISRKYLN